MDTRMHMAKHVALTALMCAATVLVATYAVELMIRPMGTTPATISVSGTAKQTYKPDIADIDIAVISKGRDAASVQAENDAKMTAVVSYLNQQGIKEDDIKTTSYGLYPEYRQVPNAGVDTSTIIGYTMTQGVQFRVRDVAAAGKVIGGLSGVGINSVGSISFSLSDEKLDVLKAAAKDQAIAKAQQELQRMKTKLGFRLARLVGMSDSPVAPMPYRLDTKYYGLGAAESSIAPIQSGTGEVIETVSLSYEVR